MGLVYMIVVGTVLGWLAAFILRRDSDRDLRVFLVAGIAGALFAGLLLSPALNIGNLASGTYTVGALLFSMAGSLAMLFVAGYLRRREVV